MKDKYKQHMIRGDGDRKDSKQNRQCVLGPHHQEERQMEKGVGGDIFRNLKIVQYNLGWNVVGRQVGIDRKEVFEFHPTNMSRYF